MFCPSWWQCKDCGNLMCLLGLHIGPVVRVLNCHETEDKVNTGCHSLLQVVQEIPADATTPQCEMGEIHPNLCT